MTGCRAALWKQGIDQSNDIRRTDNNERLYFHGFPWRGYGFCRKKNGLGVRFGVLKPGQNAFNVNTDLWKNTRCVFPIKAVSYKTFSPLKGDVLQIVGHVKNMLLGSNGNFFENLLAGVLANMVTNHNTVSLLKIRTIMIPGGLMNMPLGE